jgi:hypothetical protein
MPRKTVKRRRHVTKKRSNIRRKKPQTKRVKNSRRRRGGAQTQTQSSGWTGFLQGAAKKVNDSATGALLVQKATEKLGQHTETIGQLQTAFSAVQKQVDNQLAKYKTKKEADLLAKFQKECGNKGPGCVAEKNAEFLAKEQAENQRRTAANDAFWATLIEKDRDHDLPEYTGLSNIQLFTAIVDNWEEIEAEPALIAAVQSYYNCPKPNTKEALLDCFKKNANGVFTSAVDQFESKLRSYVGSKLTGDALFNAQYGITMASNALKASPAYASKAFQMAKGAYNAAPKTKKQLADRSRTGIESGFKTLTDNVHQDYHAPIQDMKKFLLELHDVASKLSGLQAEVRQMEEEVKVEGESDDEDGYVTPEEEE